MLIESSSVDLAVGTVKVASLSLSPNAALSLSLTSTVYSYIKRRIKLKKRDKEKKRRERGQDNKMYLSLCFVSDFSKLIVLLDLFLELGSLVAMSGLLFEPDKFFAPLIEDLMPKPLKASIFSFPGEQFLLF